MRRQQGVALVTVLMIVAIATLLAAQWMIDGRDAIEQQRLVRLNEQAWQYGMSMESWARQVLVMDNQGRPQGAYPGHDSASEPWAQPMPPMEVEGGQLAGQLLALDGGLNVNALADPEQTDLAYERLTALLGVLRLDRSLADVIADYVDADSERRASGAEDMTYLGMNPPRRAPNRPIMQTSELLHAARISPEDFAVLEPHISALPVEADINLNFASAELILALIPELTRQQAETLAQSGEFRDMGAFQNALPEQLPFDPQGLSVRSRYFLAHGVVWLDGERFDFYSLLAETGQLNHRSLYRSLGIH